MLGVVYLYVKFALKVIMVSADSTLRQEMRQQEGALV